MTAALAFLIAHRALVVRTAAILGAAMAGALLLNRLEEPGRQRAEAALHIAQQQAAAARAQTTVEAAAAVAVETARTTEIALATKTGAAADALSRAPSGAAPLPPDVVRDWARSIDGLRHDAAAAHTAASPDRGGATRAVPAT